MNDARRTLVVLAASLAACVAPPPHAPDAGDDDVDAGFVAQDGGFAPRDAGMIFGDAGFVAVDGGFVVNDGGFLTADAGHGDAGHGDAGHGDAGPFDAGHCDVDAECAGACTPLPDDPAARAYCVLEPTSVTTTCTDGGGTFGGSTCCTNDDCAQGDGGVGVCAAFSYGYCGGAAPPDENTCRFDECSADADCGDGHACLPRGAFGALVRQCVAATCRSDGDCTDGAGGACLPLWSGGCRALAGFFCTYDDDVCRTDQDCTGGSDLCEPGDGGTVCVFEPPPP